MRVDNHLYDASEIPIHDRPQSVARSSAFDTTWYLACLAIRWGLEGRFKVRLRCLSALPRYASDFTENAVAGVRYSYCMSCVGFFDSEVAWPNCLSVLSKHWEIRGYMHLQTSSLAHRSVHKPPGPVDNADRHGCGWHPLHLFSHGFAHGSGFSSSLNRPLPNSNEMQGSVIWA